MKQRIEPTHFIEQYNTTEPAHEFTKPRQAFTSLLDIKYLKSQTDTTKGLEFSRTVAIWKIRFNPPKTIQL